MKNKDVNILAVDTSTYMLSISLYKNGSTYCISKKSSDHSEELTTSLDTMLKKSNLCLDDINLLGVNRGPGSFTGLRIGLSFIRLLAKFLKVKIIATTSFSMLVYEFVKKYKIKENCKIITLFPSVKNEFYFCKFEFKNNKIQKMLKYGYIRQQEINLEEADYFVVPKFFDTNYKNYNNLVSLNFSSKQIIELFLDEDKTLYEIVSYKELFPFYIRDTYY